jgi:hypothetical protein
MSEPTVHATLAAALAAAQGEMKPAAKTREVVVTMKSGGQYAYSYAEFGAVVESVRLPLSRNGLAWTQPIAQEGTKITVRTVLMHGLSGQTLDSGPLTASAASPGPQDIGSVISYLRRYSLMALLGVATEDDDGQGGDDAPPPKTEPKTEAGKGGGKGGKGKDKPAKEAKPDKGADPPPVSLPDLLKWCEEHDLSAKMLADWCHLKGYPPPKDWDDAHRTKMAVWLHRGLASVFDQLTAAEAERALSKGEPGSNG